MLGRWRRKRAEELGLRRFIIETVSGCNLRCRMCPTRTFLPRGQVMHEGLFRRAIRHLYPGAEVLLTGWGEPLLDPGLPRRIARCKERGARVFIASNATLLTEELAAALLDSGLDGVSFSLDAGSAATYSAVRGAELERALAGVRALLDLRRRRGAACRVEASFVAMKQNLEDLPTFLHRMEELGVDAVCVTPRFLLFCERDQRETHVEPALIAAKVREEAPKHPGIETKTYGLDHFPRGDCLAEATSTVFVSASGEVSACCNLGHPAPRLLPDGSVFVPYTVFGHLERDDLVEIWNSEAFKRFRQTLARGGTPAPCRGCLLLPHSSSRTTMDCVSSEGRRRRKDTPSSGAENSSHPRG